MHGKWNSREIYKIVSYCWLQSEKYEFLRGFDMCMDLQKIVAFIDSLKHLHFDPEKNAFFYSVELHLKTERKEEKNMAYHTNERQQLEMIDIRILFVEMKKKRRICILSAFIIIFASLRQRFHCIFFLHFSLLDGMLNFLFHSSVW